MSHATLNTQTTILSRALSAVAEPMGEELARYLLSIRLDPADEQRANQLAEIAREGLLSTEEQVEIDEYRRVGRVMEILRLRARKSLGHTG